MMTQRRIGLSVGGLTALVLTVSTSLAHAHICMDAPTPRACDNIQQKQGPCGSRTGRQPNKVTTFRPGETITVRINEKINHRSHYRIAFNPNGDKFEDPVSVDDKNGKHPYVLLDNIEDEAAAVQSVKVTLPNVECDNCTLQLIQVMYDKGGNGFAGNDGVGTRGDDLYYACADIVLKGEPAAGAADAGVAAAPTGPTLDGGTLASIEEGTEESDSEVEALADAGGCALGSGSGGAAFALLGLGALIARARRRR